MLEDLVSQYNTPCAQMTYSIPYWSAAHHIEDSCQGSTNIVEGNAQKLESEVVEGNHTHEHT